MLDAGCGSGVAATDLKAAGYLGANVNGIDIWEGGLAHARSRDFYRDLH